MTAMAPEHERLEEVPTTTLSVERCHLVTSAWEGMNEGARAAEPEHGRTFILDVASRGRAEGDVRLGGA
jgi:hypothetical protein